jgi:hypothetical protein
MEFLLMDIMDKVDVTYRTAERIAELILLGFDIATVAALVGGVAGFVLKMIFHIREKET